MPKWDVIVIGAGGMGSAVAYHVAARGRKVLALEQFNIPNEFGSSGGINRIISLTAGSYCRNGRLSRTYPPR